MYESEDENRGGRRGCHDRSKCNSIVSALSRNKMSDDYI